MKKLLLALLLFLLPTVAQAGVPCSVPFNLTNGTTADATQVMANYNAILSCLSTSTAASGGNTDITSLGAVTSIGPLSTPITPAQGGAQALCGATGFTAVNDTGTPTTELDIAYTEAIVTNISGAIQRGTFGSLVLNAGTTGANGIDTGALAASSNYYIYLIGNGSVIASLISLSSTAPTLPSGYTYSCRIGAWTTDTNLHFVFGQIRGRNFVLEQSPVFNLNAGVFQLTSNSAIGSCGGTTDTTVLKTFTGLPVTAIMATGAIFSTGVLSISSVGPSTPAHNEVQNVNSLAVNLNYQLVLPSPQSFYVCAGASSGQFVIVWGWTDNTNAN